MKAKLQWQLKKRPYWAYEFPDLTGQDTQISQTGPARWTGMNPDLYFQIFYLPSTDKVPGHKFGVKSS